MVDVNPIAAGIMFLILIFSVVIHEVSHGYVAYRLGDPTAQAMKRLTSDWCRRIGTWQNLGASPSRPAVFIYMVDIWTESVIRSPSCRELAQRPSLEDTCEHLVHRVFPRAWLLRGLTLVVARCARCC